MRKFPLVFALCLVAGTAMASAPTLFMGGSGAPNVVATGRDASWSEPPDLNGLIGSSEQILAFGLESELANDFVLNDAYGYIGLVTFWGGYYNNSTPCSAGIATPGFNLKFYSDGGCVPASTTPDVAWIVATIGAFNETSMGCQQGVFPMFRWDIYYVNVNVTTGNLYWFGAQMLDHAFPPQGGRLAAASVTGCDTVFRSVYFGYPDWTPAIDIFGVAFDCSQEFQPWGDIGHDPPEGACCLSNGECRIESSGYCQTLGGQYQGDYSSCNSSPCGITSSVGTERVQTQSTTWGRIRASFR